MKNLPPTKNDNIVVQNIGKEILIYDLGSHRAYCLNETLAKIYAACDGKMTFQEFKKLHPFTDDLIFLSLDELKRENLIETIDDYESPFATLTRREAIKRVGLATSFALPLISSLVVPSAINAASPTTPCSNTANTPCPFNGTFTQGICCDGLRCLDNGFCTTCRGSGVIFNSYVISSNPAGCTSIECDLLPQKNWCCNPGISSATDNGINLCICRCP